jgi:hypothetical protein
MTENPESPDTGPPPDPSAVDELAADTDRKRRLKRRRYLGLAMLFVGALILLSGAWLAVTGLLARNELQTVRSEMHQLRRQISAGDLPGARVTAASLAGHAERAHWLTTGPVWALAADLPAGGEPVETVRGITSSADLLASQALPGLVRASKDLDPATLRLPDGSINVAAIAANAPNIARADAAMQEATARVAALPKRTWITTVDTARSDVLAQLESLGKTVHSVDLGASIAPKMLGLDGPQRYFVAFQNNAEARGTGGLPGAFGILVVDHGRLHFTHFEPDNTLRHVDSGVQLGADFNGLYGGDKSTNLYVNSNVSPNFPYAGQIWAAMWQKVSGEKVDGAIALDPTGLSYLLEVTGPATLKDGTKVGADNVVSLTQSTVYSTISSTAVRKQYLLQVAKAVSTEIVQAHGSTKSLVKAAGRAAGERRLLVWSRDPSIEAALDQTSLSGTIPVTSAPYVGVSVSNGLGNKLDYYLDRSVTWQRTGCGATRDVTVSIALTNSAPSKALPPYVDPPEYIKGGKPVGDNVLDISYLATAGATLTSATDGGRAVFVYNGAERGHPTFALQVPVPRGRTTTVVLRLKEPAGTGAPVVLRQPLVRPLTVKLDDAGCG